MNARSLRHLSWMALLLAGAAQAAVCNLDDSPRTCSAKLVASIEQQAEADSAGAETAAAETLGKVNTGASTAIATQPTSAFNDFFSLLNVGARSEVTGSAEDEAMGFEWNGCAPGGTIQRKLQCQLRGRIGESELYEPLVQALPEATRAAREDELSEQLDQADNVTAGLFFNYVSRSFGRVPQFGSGSVYANLRAQVNEEMRAERLKSFGGAFEWNRFLGTLPKTERFDPDDPDPTLAFREYPEQRGAEALALYEQTILPRLQVATQTRARLENYGYFDLIRLVNNQPQINAGIEFNHRGELSGPDELRAKVSYEFGLVDLNDLHSYIATRSEQCAPTRPANSERWLGVAGCTQAFLRAADVQRALDSSNRFAFTLEYKRRKHYVVDLPDDGVLLDLPSETSLVGSLVWGGYLRVGSSDALATRFDLAAGYEDVSSDPLRQDRGIANLTFSHNLANGFIASATIVYATKPEFRGEVQKEWSSRLGVNYKFGFAE